MAGVNIIASIIIVNFNGRKFLEDCFNSLLKQTFTDFEIIFVDNSSTDGSAEFVQEKFKDDRIKIVRSESNLGFAGGNNFGYRHCKGEYVVLLNNDTRADSRWLEELITCISLSEHIGIAQSLVLTEGIPMKYYETNGSINLLGQNIMEVFEIDKNGVGEIFQANGCSLMIRKKLADETGGLFDDEYFAYSEDTYLCFKIKFKGLKIMHTSKSIIYHKGGGTSDPGKRRMLYYYQERNRLLNFILFFSAGFRIKYMPFLGFNFAIKSVLSLFSGKYFLPELAKAYLWLICRRSSIKEKRNFLNKLKSVREEEVLKYLSGKVFNGNNIFERTANTVSLLYCRLTRIKVHELSSRIG